MFYFVLLVALVYSFAAFGLRNAEPRVARIFWGLVALLVVGMILLVLALVYVPGFQRNFFGPL